MNLEERVAMITSYPFDGKISAKLGDPGIPTISYSMGNIDIHNALCDIRTWVSIMPLTLYKRLNWGECVPTAITLQLNKTSTKMSIGVAEDVLLRLDRHIIPIDVTILDMSEDEKLSTILERPFWTPQVQLWTVLKGR